MQVGQTIYSAHIMTVPSTFLRIETREVFSMNPDGSVETLDGMLFGPGLLALVWAETEGDALLLLADRVQAEINYLKGKERNDAIKELQDLQNVGTIKQYRDLINQ